MSRLREHFMKLAQALQTSVKGKLQWTTENQELRELFKPFLLENISTFAQVEYFLKKEKFNYRSDILEGNTVIVCSSQGPTLWHGYLPVGSMYTIIFQFENNTLSSIKGNLIDLHL